MSGNRFSSFVFVTITVLSLALISPPARAATTDFGQIDWGTGVGGGFEIQNSAWGEVTLGLGAVDTGLLTADGFGGFFSYVNVVTTVAGGSNNNWAVQNLVVSFDSLSDLGGSLPTTINFDLGSPDGTDITTLNYSLTFSSAPLAIQPGGPLTPTSVANDYLADGTEDDPNAFGDASGQPPSDFVGAAAATGIGARGRITGSETNVPAINESLNGCAPGAAARSIAYMSSQGAYALTSTPQGVFLSLTNSMQTTTNAGTSGVNLISGKNAFVSSNGLPIAATFFTNNFSLAINSLNKTGDVELGISWGFKVNGNGTTNFFGGHAVFLSQIIPITNSVGTIVSYQLRYIEDTIQGDGIASNNVRTMLVSPTGADLNAPAGVQGRGAFGFFIENTTAVPEPSTFGMTVLGTIGAIWVRRRRRRH